MFNKNIKLIIAGLIFAFAIYQIYDSYIGNGIFLILLAAIFVLLYFKNEFILLSFLKLRKQDFDGTKRILSKIKNPATALTTKQQGYYYYLHGIMASQDNLTQAEKHLRKAEKLGLSMDHDMAMVKMTLAGIASQKNRKNEAKILMKEAKALDKRGMLSEQMKMMEQQMKRAASAPKQHYGNRQQMKRR
ncbi:DUF2892 domain-containing protein [Kordia sp. YSTF-M3]|uniref:DUF2892 domain-containing protein n=1 Tax=Kordia aestuariivivens TaxID=2759037 RepID=A0ABR7QE97_9FLAO|nr:DUF2892 domain-containing protein [Kordia aestuariivivens]MBC8756897.1 DUF2892 domain-containing protein [Kordia aestuariivivens]